MFVLFILMPSYLLLASCLLRLFLHLIQILYHQSCIFSSTPHNWHVVKWYNIFTVQLNIVIGVEKRVIESSTQRSFLLEGYKFFLFFLLLITWPLSVLIFFFWSSFPISLTKRFLLRSLKKEGGKKTLNYSLKWPFGGYWVKHREICTISSFSSAG